MTETKMHSFWRHGVLLDAATAVWNVRYHHCNKPLTMRHFIRELKRHQSINELTDAGTQYLYIRIIHCVQKKHTLLFSCITLRKNNQNE